MENVDLTKWKKTMTYQSRDTELVCISNFLRTHIDRLNFKGNEVDLIIILSYLIKS